MGIFHFLNVGHGDCSIIEHPSGRVTVIDVSKARKENNNSTITSAPCFSDIIRGNNRPFSLAEAILPKSSSIQTFEEDTVNPISYMKKHNISSIFRFILTHPDMDHMNGIKDLFEEIKEIPAASSGVF